MKRLIAILFALALCLSIAYYIHLFFYLPNEPNNQKIFNINNNKTGLQINKQSERNEGNRSITVYKSLDDKIWISVVKSHGQSDVSEMGLIKEIENFANGPLENQWADPIPTHSIDNHIAVSTQLIEVGRKSNSPTYSVPDKYITAIGYPEKNLILLVMSNGENVTWDIQGDMVNRFKL
jgi:hypothetical protein